MLGRCSAGCLHQRLPTKGMSRIVDCPVCDGLRVCAEEGGGVAGGYFIGEVSKGPVF